MLNTIHRLNLSTELELLRESTRRFIAEEFLPNLETFEKQGKVSRAFWQQAGNAGLLCPMASTEHGGAGLDFRYNSIINEELSYAAASDCLMLQSDITFPYIDKYGSTEQKNTWIPRMISGETITAIAMTEPGAGSDLQGIQTRARRDGNDFVVNGSKTYITNGQNADLVILVVKTDANAGAQGISLLLVESDRKGFERGRNLAKVGQWSADTSELFFNEVRVPVTNLLGAENQGFACLVSELAQERLSISVTSQAAAQRAYDEAVAYVRDRRAFGKKIIEFQNTRFTLADLKSRLQIGWAHLDWAVQRHIEGKLTVEQAAASKYWHTETQWMIVDAAMQLHGGAGYMNEYPIARVWRDARVRRLYGGSSEIMKEIVSRDL